MKFKVIKILMLVLCFLSVVSYASQNHSKENGRYELINEVKKELMQLEPAQTKWRANNYVSIAQVNKDYFVIANYVDLLLLDNRTNTLCILKPQGLIKAVDATSLREVYRPTGVFFDQKEKLYVANYKGNNILEGIINTQKCEVNFIREFSSKNTKGPENVSVDGNQNILVSANYDSGTITAFNVTNGRELWSRKIGQAHGVALWGNRVYATGLTTRKIYKLDLNDGKILSSKGTIGWDPMKSQFLWPTSIYPYSEDKLVVADAQSGFISFLDKDTLKTIKYTGGNGPSYQWFNYPYTAYPSNNQLIILSSMRGNILFLDYSGTRVKKNLISFKNNWAKLDYSHQYFGKGWTDYINTDNTNIRIRDQNYRLGFGHLHPIDSGPILRVPDIVTLYNLGPYIYFLQGFHHNNVNYIFSSSSTTALGVIKHSDYADLLLPQKIRLDSWHFRKKLIDVDGHISSEKQLSAQLNEHAEKFYSILRNEGWISPLNLYQLNDFFTGIGKLPYDKFVKYLDEVFKSSIGREFKHSYDQCVEKNCDVEQLQVAAKRYYTEADGYAYLNMDEYLLVGMLTNFKSPHIKYDDCGKGEYYEGYGIDAITNPTKASYLSAYDLDRSYLCFNKEYSKDEILDKVNIGWYSKEEVAKKIAIYGLQNENQKKQLLGTFNIKNVYEKDGYLYTRILLNTQQYYDKYLVKVIRGGQQNRLILRSLLPEFKQVNSTISYDDCQGLGHYYKGYGLEALARKTLQSYLSAYDTDSSYICFKNENKKILSRILFGWYSREEIPKKLQLYGISNKNNKPGEILLKSFKIDQIEELNGYVFSTLDLDETHQYEHYKIKLIAGGKQNRLLLRLLEPQFKSTLKNNNELIRLADKIREKRPYGLGIQKIAAHVSCNPQSVNQYMLGVPTAHCGNYAYIFINALSSSHQWTVFSLKTFDGRIHVVVQINDLGVTIDPTLGVLYPCTVSSLVNGSCNYDLAEYSKPIFPALSMYFGKGFFYGAQINNVYFNVTDLTNIYCNKNSLEMDWNKKKIKKLVETIYQTLTHNHKNPGLGKDNSFPKQSIVHAMVLSHFTIGSALAGNKEATRTGATNLIELLDLNNKGWGLGFPYETFAEYRKFKEVNPAETTYGITNALAIESLFDAYSLLGIPEYRDRALKVLDYYIQTAFESINNEEGYFYYSDQKNDREYTVHNVTSMLMGVCARAYTLTNNKNYLTIANKSKRYLLKEMSSDGSWPYMSDKDGKGYALNDAAHAALTVQGFINYNKYSFEDRVNIKKQINYLETMARNMKGVHGEQLWGVGQMIYTLTDGGAQERIVTKIITEVLPKFMLDNGGYAWRVGSTDSYIRPTSFLFYGLSLFAYKSSISI